MYWRYVEQKQDGENINFKHVGYMNLKFKTKKMHVTIMKNAILILDP
jgi:hypothetical protein